LIVLKIPDGVEQMPGFPLPHVIMQIKIKAIYNA
jgi:hypothetical protein